MVEIWKSKGNGFKVREEMFEGDVQDIYFTLWVVGAWKALPSEVVVTDTVTTL